MKTADLGREEKTADCVASSTAPDSEVSAFLDEIPTETTRDERRFLFNFFRTAWSGYGHVVEVGPFLGGTTRAIAHGMMHNSRRSPTAGLHTFDRFSAYYTPQRLRQTVEPLVRCGALSSDAADRWCDRGEFLKLFEAIHARHPYACLLHPHDSPLPDFPEEIEASNALGVLADEHELGAIFIDGCKSWASTHYAMAFLLPRLEIGAPVIFQDFGWYTCFWISAAVHALDGLLAWESHVDATYVFRLTEAVKAEQVAQRFAKDPTQMGVAFFQSARTDLLDRSRRTGDVRGELIAQLHYVAALATLNRKQEASAVLKSLDVRRYAAYADMVRGCIKSPTYRAGGKPILWNEVGSEA